MKPLAVNGYTAQDVLNALRREHGSAQWSFRYQLLDKDGVVQGDLTNVTSGSLTHDTSAVIKTTARFNIIEDNSIDYLSDRIKPWIRLRMPDGGWAEWAQGVFLLVTPKRISDLASVISRQIAAYDMTMVLDEDTVSDRYFVGQGARYTDAVVELLDNTLGIWTWNVTPSALTLPAAKEWDPGTSKYNIIKWLTDAINYNPIWFNGDGVAQVLPYVNPNDRTAEFDYSTDANSVTLPDASQTLDLFKRPNRWVFYVSNPDQATLRVERLNNSLNSATSIPNRGRTITSMVKIDTAPDLFVLGQIADQKVQESAMVDEVIDFSTGIMPIHENLDMYSFDYTTMVPAGNYVEQTWSLDLRPDAAMRHTAKRVVEIL